MLLCEIDSEINVQNGGFSVKLRNGDDGDMLHDWWLRFYVCLRLRDRDSFPQLTATAVTMHPRRRMSKRWHVADIKKLHWRWPDNPNGRLKTSQFTLITFTRSPLTIRRRIRRSLKRHVADVKNIARKDQDRSKFRKYKNLWLRNQVKRLEKLRFAATNDAAIDGIVHCFFSYYH